MPGNANSGRNKKPTVMKVLEGTYRKDRANLNEPKIKEVKIPPAPHVKLNQWGMEEWKRLTVQLIGIGVLAETDITQLSALCYEWGEFVECGENIKEIKDVDDKFPMPELTPEQRLELMRIKYMAGKNQEKLRKEHLEAYNKLAQQFGLSPSSRAKVNAPAKEEKDEFDDI
jgi:P27 family predicted phage terminase small subunit